MSSSFTPKESPSCRRRCRAYYHFRKAAAATFLAVMMCYTAHARLGENEQEMVARFGKPKLRSKHSIIAQGKIRELGPSLYFKQDDWGIHCDLVDGRCVRIAYSKPGEWTPEQFQTVLSANSQGTKWSDTSNPSVVKLQRTWRRGDGATATWQLGQGIRLVTPTYERAKANAEAKAKDEAGRTPKI